MANPSKVSKRATLKDIWPRIEDGLTRLIVNLNEGFPRKKWMDLYSDVYNYCTTNRVAPSKSSMGSGANYVGQELYALLQDFLTRRLNTILKIALQRLDESLLHFYNTEWERYTTCMRYVNHIFAYLNRHWIQRKIEEGESDVYPVNVLALVLWKRNLFSALQPRLTSAILSLIEKERNGEQIDQHLVAGVVGGFVDLGLKPDNFKQKTLDVYKLFLQGEFLAASERYYRAESQFFISKNDICDYMRKVETRLQQEKRRVQQYLHPSTEYSLLNKLEKVLIGQQMDKFWAEFQNLLEADKYADLHRMYKLLKLIPNGLEPLKAILETHVLTVGSNAVTELVSSNMQSDPRAYVERLLEVYQKYWHLVQHSFLSDSSFIVHLDKACRRFVNDNAVSKPGETKSPELLARYCDMLLRKNPNNPEGDDLDQLLHHLIVLFKYIEDKDVFQSFYAKFLARRLIHGQSESEDLEGLMISRLKASWGHEYTTKLQRMFSDMGTSRDLLSQFKAGLQTNNDKLPFDFSALVLATGSWPLQSSVAQFNLPKELLFCERKFVSFYATKHSGRKLHWMYLLSKGELRARYTTTNRAGYTFQCTTYQMGVLMLFNNAETLTADEIHQATMLNEQGMRNTLLALVKTRVLLIDPKPDGNTITKDAKFTLNTLFKSKKTRVNIAVPVSAQQKQERQETMKNIEEDRKNMIQAAIVRIMKTRKELPHAQLMTEVISQLNGRFNPKVSIIKKSIDYLIQQEYIKRAEEQKDVYQYVA